MAAGELARGERVAVTPRARARPALTLDAVWLAVAVAYPFVVLNFASFAPDDGDFWWTLALGRELWTTGALPATEPLAFTPTTSPYIYAQWLAGLLLYGTWRLGGFELLLVLRAAIVGVTFGLVYLGCRRAGAAPTLAGPCTLLALPLVNVGLALRPQIFALIPFVLYLEATRHPLAGGRWRWLLPLVMVFWANVHGSFLIGIGLVAIALVGTALDVAHGWGPRAVSRDAAVRWLAVLLALSALAPLVNPYGLGVLTYLRTMQAVAPNAHLGLGGLLTEWLPTSLGTPGGPAFLASLGVLAAALYWTRERLPTAEVLRLVAFAVLALRHLRGIIWWGLVLPAPLAALLQRALPRRPTATAVPDRPAINALALALVLGGCVVSLPWWRGPNGGRLFDVSLVEAAPLQGAVSWLDSQAAPAPLFHYIAWGPYLAWRLDTPLLVDGRFEAYQPAVFADYVAISQGAPGWEERLTAYGVERLVLSREGQAGLVRAVRESTAWQPEYADRDVLIYRRAAGP